MGPSLRVDLSQIGIGTQVASCCGRLARSVPLPQQPGIWATDCSVTRRAYRIGVAELRRVGVGSTVLFDSRYVNGRFIAGVRRFSISVSRRRKLRPGADWATGDGGETNRSADVPRYSRCFERLADSHLSMQQAKSPGGGRGRIGPGSDSTCGRSFGEIARRPAVQTEAAGRTVGALGLSFLSELRVLRMLRMLRMLSHSILFLFDHGLPNSPPGTNVCFLVTVRRVVGGRGCLCGRF